MTEALTLAASWMRRRALRAADNAALPEIVDAVRLVRAGTGIILTLVVFLGAWAVLSPLDSAAITFGVVGPEGSRRVVQHIDGGVVRAILVKEGDLVSAGQKLIELDPLQARAALEIQTTAVDTYSALISRLEAESAGSAEIAYPADLAQRAATQPSVKELLRSQEQVFAARRTAMAAQIATLGETIKQAQSQAAIYRGQVEIVDRQYQLISQELVPKEDLFSKGLGTIGPVLQLRRAATALLGQRQEYMGNIDRLDHSVGQLESQIRQITSDHRLKVAQELEDARNKLADARERQRIAQDVLDRTVIRSPVSGHVLGLNTHTIGGVIARGERLLEVVPIDDDLLIKARLKAMDGVEVSEGMRAELRLLSAQGRKLPLMHGVVRSRSADARFDPGSAASYYDVDVAIDPDDLRANPDVRLLPGSPVEVIVPTGSRSALRYLLEPVADSFRHGLREK
jgi:HlyD family type I secretion membrane fusion protein